MTKLNISTITCALLVSFGSNYVNATQIKLPGISIDDNGIQAGNITIDDNGVAIEPGRGSRDRLRKQGPKIDKVDHSRSNYENVDLAGARISNSTFSRTNLRGVNLRSANITRSNFSRSKLAGANLRGVVFENVDFSRANLDGVNLRGATFKNSNFSRANFKGACLYGAKFINTNFTRTNFTDAILTNTSNTQSDFTRAVLKNVYRVPTCGAGVNNAQFIETESETTVRVEIATASAIVTALNEGDNARISLTINFESDSDRIQGQARQQIQEIHNALDADVLAGTTVLIEGHTDSTGQEDYNQSLSYRRASRVKSILVRRYGIDEQRLAIAGLGESAPIASNASNSGRALNRRVTLVNLGYKQ